MELVGGPYFGGDLQVLAKRGRMIIVGTIAGSRTEIDLGLVLRKRLRLIGTALRSRTPEEKIALAEEFTERVTPLFDTGHLKPVIDRVFRFSEIRQAHELMESNDTFGKIVLSWD
jgi:NADPH:quinone reductase-like Zn-dependent oxidoreductase